MTENSQLFLNDWFERYVNRYRDGGGSLPFALELKYTHSLRVAENARLIARGLALATENVQMAYTCGVVHDVGRFSQYEQYGSFHDADTVDHGLAGRQAMEATEAPSHFPPDEWSAIACVVEYHNKKTSDLPGNISGESARLLGIIRDADKLDIMDLVLQSVARDGFRELPDMLPHVGLSRELTPAVLEEFQKNKTISTGSLATVADFLVMLATWFYDLNYLPSRRLALQRDLPGRLARELPDNPVIRKVFARIRKTVFLTSIS